MELNGSNTIKFEKIKDRLIQKINEKLSALNIMEPVTLVDGFINQPISLELSGSFIIGGPTVPMIMIVGTTTGRVHFLALKVIWPDFDK